MKKFGLSLVAFLTVVAPGNARAGDPFLSEMKKGQEIKVVQDIPVGAGDEALQFTEFDNGSGWCGFRLDAFVQDRVIPAGTVLIIQEVESWNQFTPCISHPALGKYCLGGTTDAGTSLTLSQPTGFDRVEFFCNSDKVDYKSLKNTSSPYLRFP